MTGLSGAGPPDEMRSSGLTLSQVAAVAAGNALQFYDFLSYSFFATQIGRTFFPSHDATTSLLASLATFGVGYLSRPLGAVLIGMLGDRRGRKPAMILSFALMSLGVVGLAATPSYATIGVAAPILAIAFRLIQGFALGGEVGPSTAFLVEAAPARRRGLYVSFQYMTQDGAVLLAGLVGMALAHLLSPDALDLWGWRVAFLLGATLVPIGLLLRQRLPETLAEGSHALAAAVVQPLQARSALLGLVMLSAATVCFVTLNYMATFATHTLGLKPAVAFLATITVGLCGLVFDPLGGWLSDRFGRKVVMIAPWVLALTLPIPCFWVLVHASSRATLLACTAVLAIPVEVATSSVLVSVAESAPLKARSGVIATIYAISATLFGGSTQFVLTWLIRATGSPLAPGWYMTGAVALGLAAMCMTRETAPIALATPRGVDLRQETVRSLA